MDMCCCVVLFMCRTRSSSGPKPVPLLPRNTEDSKDKVRLALHHLDVCIHGLVRAFLTARTENRHHYTACQLTMGLSGFEKCPN